MTVHVFCPAKVNTFLSVGRPDAHGWHPIRTIFQTIDFGDELALSLSDRDEVVSNVDWLPKDNSIIQALAALRRHVSVPPIRVDLTKRIPARAGLGGGSSDAAGVLRGVRKLMKSHLAEDVQHSIASGLGADVPFFLVGGRAKAEGYGEILTPLPDQRETFLLVVKPDVDCSTPEMYARLDAVDREWREFPTSDELFNDFEKVAPEACHRALELLSAYRADGVGLSGSGSAVFGTFSDHTAMLTAATLMRAEGYVQVWPAHSLSREASLRVRAEP